MTSLDDEIFYPKHTRTDEKIQTTASVTIREGRFPAFHLAPVSRKSFASLIFAAMYGEPPKQKTITDQVR